MDNPNSPDTARLYQFVCATEGNYERMTVNQQNQRFLDIEVVDPEVILGSHAVSFCSSSTQTTVNQTELTSPISIINDAKLSAFSVSAASQLIMDESKVYAVPSPGVIDLDEQFPEYFRKGI